LAHTKNKFDHSIKLWPLQMKNLSSTTMQLIFIS
jgi:hypothetical protein